MVDAAPDAVGSRHMYMGHRRSGVGKLGRAGGLEGREVPADFVRSPAVERYIAERASGTSYSNRLRSLLTRVGGYPLVARICCASRHADQVETSGFSASPTLVMTPGV